MVLLINSNPYIGRKSLKIMNSLIKKSLNKEETALVHGTSIESVLKLLEKNKLQREQFSKFRINETYDDYLFFIPNPEKLRKHGIDTKFEDLESWEEDIIETSKLYAEQVAFKHYLDSKFSDLSEEICMVELMDYSTLELEKYHLNLYEGGVSEKIAREQLLIASSRKGVLLGHDENILELMIEEGKDVPEEEVCIYLPNGLDIKYISEIVPLGNYEKETLY